MFGLLRHMFGGEHTPRNAGDNSPAFAFPKNISEKNGEEHYIVDHTGHFLSDRETVDEGMREGYLVYGGHARIAGKVRHIYSVHPDHFRITE